MGKTRWRQEVARARRANAAIRRAIEKVLENRNSPSRIDVEVNKVLLALLENAEAVTELEVIGEQTKSQRG